MSYAITFDVIREYIQTNIRDCHFRELWIACRKRIAIILIFYNINMLKQYFKIKLLGTLLFNPKSRFENLQGFIMSIKDTYLSNISYLTFIIHQFHADSCCINNKLIKSEWKHDQNISLCLNIDARWYYLPMPPIT